MQLYPPLRRFLSSDVVKVWGGHVVGILPRGYCAGVCRFFTFSRSGSSPCSVCRSCRAVALSVWVSLLLSAREKIMQHTPRELCSSFTLSRSSPCRSYRGEGHAGTCSGSPSEKTNKVDLLCLSVSQSKKFFKKPIY